MFLSRGHRILSVDIFKLLAIIAVISLHTRPFETDVPHINDLYGYLNLFINQFARFAVPFFFVVSGYFWGAGIKDEYQLIPNTLKLTKKVFTIFMFWCVIYLPLYDAELNFQEPLQLLKDLFWGVHWHIKVLLTHPLHFLMEGSKVHLWFLVGLLFSVSISAVFIYHKWLTGLVLSALALYAIGVLAGAYANTPIGLTIGFNTRNGPFFGTLLFVSGYFMSGFKMTTHWLLYGFIIYCIGSLLQLTEIYILWTKFATTPLQDYVFGTYFVGIGVAMMALSNHKALQSQVLSTIGQMTLGIYAIHYMFVDLLKVIDKNMNSPWWEVGYVVIVLVLSILSTLALSKFQFTRDYALGERRSLSDRRKVAR